MASHLLAPAPGAGLGGRGIPHAARMRHAAQAAASAFQKLPSRCSLGSARRITLELRCGAGTVRALIAGEGEEAAKKDAPSRSTGVDPGSVSVVLLSGGVGKRMKASMPKQYLQLNGQPIATYSLLTFASMPEVGEIIVVCDPSFQSIFLDAFASAPSEVVHRPQLRFALPGRERQDSVLSGLQCVRQHALLVAVHDSARPLVTAAEARSVFEDAATHGAAVLGVRAKATIKEADERGFVARTLDRKLLWEMQTPQVMRPQLLRDGFKLVLEQGLEVTDDVSIVEHLGHAVKITEGLYTNIKVTTPDDMLIAQKLLADISVHNLCTSTSI